MQYYPGQERPHVNRPESNEGISVATTVFITILVAAVAFLAGLRFDQYRLDLGGGGANSELPADLDYSSVEEVYDRLRATYDGSLSETDLLNGLKRGLAEASGDTYTVYLSAEQYEQFNSDLNGTFSGIGAEIGLENEILIIVAPLDGFPAQAAGLRPGDQIIKIDGEDAIGLSVEEAVLKIRGEKGTDVSLTILRNSEQLEFTITRDDITIPSVTTEIENNIGYLRISRFADDTATLARQAANEFVAANVEGVVVDLRNNSGGYLASAVEVAGLWLDNQVVVETRENGGQLVTHSQRTSRGAVLKDVPTMVLINEGSASASEIVAGALQDYKVATLVGTTSFGKGSVQTLEEFADGSVLKVTSARWYTPEGRNIDEAGIVPDIEVEITDEDIENEIDPQRQRAEAELQNR